jgi:hypothetical protein
MIRVVRELAIRLTNFCTLPSHEETEMFRTTIGGPFLALLGIVCVAMVPGTVVAQYNCAVAIEHKGKDILKGQIRDVERPPTDQLWELLKTLSFSPTANGNDLPDPKSVEKTTLKGTLKVKINGAGNVELSELNLVRNKLTKTAWVIAPEDVIRILKMRKADNAPKK